MKAPIHTAGNRKPWQYRPSDDRMGNAPHVYGPLRPMQEPRPWWRKLVRP